MQKKKKVIKALKVKKVVKVAEKFGGLKKHSLKIEPINVFALVSCG